MQDFLFGAFTSNPFISNYPVLRYTCVTLRHHFNEAAIELFSFIDLIIKFADY
jgi:hypothetical protein